jgi:hypothetical protein
MTRPAEKTHKIPRCANDNEGPFCETCRNEGFIDQRLGGYATSAVVECPDCYRGKEFVR